jgi:hypothetical protein
MRLQDRRRRHRAHRTGEAVPDGFRFPRIGHDAHDLARGEDLTDRDADRACRHVRDRLEPPFTNLLAPARFVELDDQVGLVGLEVGRRVVEGQVAVLADADERAIDRRLADGGADPAADLLRVLRAVEQVMPRDAGRPDQALLQVALKARRMVRAHADVLVEMKHLDASPVDAGTGGERLEKLELRCAGGRQDPGLAAGGDGPGNRAGGLAGGGLAERTFVGEHERRHGHGWRDSSGSDGGCQARGLSRDEKWDGLGELSKNV